MSTPIPPTTSTARPWYKQLWPWLLISGPALVVVAGSYAVWLAITYQDPMVVDDYYKEGKAINQDLRRSRIAEDLRIALTLTYAPANGTLSGHVISHGVPLVQKLRLHLTHPTRPEKDIQLQFQSNPDGYFSIALPALEPARWQVKLENDQRDWRLTGLWKWPEQHSITVPLGY